MKSTYYGTVQLSFRTPFTVVAESEDEARKLVAAEHARYCSGSTLQVDEGDLEDVDVDGIEAPEGEEQQQ